MNPADLTAEDADDPAKESCLPCQVGLCAGCLWADRPTSCAHDCDWLHADMTLHFPSLRGTP